jgi:KDO2-lipid IV(A) lauroyltransferase
LLTPLRLIGRLPLSVLHPAGVVAGWIAWLADPVFRRRLRSNLVASGLVTDEPAIRRVLREAVASAGRAVLELPWLWCRPQAEVAARVQVVHGEAWLREAQAAGRGILFLTPHLGAFEVTPQWYGLDRRITVMYRRPRLEWLDPLLRAGRARGRIALVPADLSGVRALLRALRAGEAVGLLPDQAPAAGEGIWAPFFGRPAWTMTLVGRLARATGATVLMAFARRLPGRGYALEFHPVALPPDGDARADARAVNAAVEAAVARCPGQYLWSYNRHKRPAGVPEPPAPGAGT